MKEVQSHMQIQADLSDLDARLRIVLPPEYQESYEEVQPVSMGSAGLKFDGAGKVAWDEIWGSFCDLAMAGGPPHKGKLLEPAGKAEIDAQPDRYRAVVEEICRGIRMVSDVAVDVSPNPGWVRVMCSTAVMAEWLVRAIVMENVSAYVEGEVVELPAGPHYRLEKEIKNVVTAVAKTHHYFSGHLERGQQRRIASLFAEAGAPLLQPSRPGEAGSADRIRAWKATASEKLTSATGLKVGGAEYAGWLGLECASVRAAIWMMRALVVNNVLARREDKVLYVAANPILDPVGDRLAGAVRRVFRLAVARGLSV
ncbi:MAG: hypothetical protein SFV51_26285 [Bryobacteraceae bacterium]|nr:hypothetical protein [Bryobacteraceae bacterium]